MIKKIEVLIIEDEINARELLRNYCSQIPELHIVGECENGFEGAKMIHELNPQLVLLDIQMPKLNGLEMLELIENPPIIIFTTAYDEFALKAFEHNAADYLLKPFSFDKFSKAIQKAGNKIKNNSGSKLNYKSLITEVQEKDEYIQRIAVKSGSEITILPVNQINYIESCDDYVILHTSKEQFVKEATMKYFETHLDRDEFIRIHRSSIVRLEQISKIENYEKDNYLLILKTGERLNISKSGYKLLKEVLKF